MVIDYVRCIYCESIQDANTNKSREQRDRETEVKAEHWKVQCSRREDEKIIFIEQGWMSAKQRKKRM